MKNPLFSIFLFGLTLISFVGFSNTTPIKNINNYCSGVTAYGGVGKFTVNGVTAHWQRIQYRPSYASSYSLVCEDNCGNPQEVTGLPAGIYVVKVEQSDANSNGYCSQEYTVNVAAAQVIDYCKDVTAHGDVEQITVKGVNAPWHRILYRLDGTSSYTEICNDNCNDPQVLSGLSAGTYVIKVEQSSGGSVNFCSKDIAVIVKSARKDYCAGVSVLGGIEKVTIHGVNAPWNRIQYRLEGSSTYYDICNDNCSDPQIATGLTAGTYIIRIEQSDGGSQNYCSQEYAAIVTSPRRDYCAGISVLGGVEKVTIHGVNAPWNRIQYRLEGSHTYYDICNDNCSDPQSLSGLQAGTYIIRVEQSDGGSQNYCSQEYAAIVTSARRDYCADVSVLGGVEKVTIHGVNAPWNRIQYRLEGSHTYYDICNDNCSDPQTATGLHAGTYIIRVEQSDGGSQNYCSQEYAAIVTDANSVDYCSDVHISSQANKIRISGVNATWNRIQLRGPSTNHHLVTICDDNCYDAYYKYIIIGNLLPGHYTVITEESEIGHRNYCKVEKTIYVSKHLAGSNSGSRVITDKSSDLLQPTIAWENRLKKEVSKEVKTNNKPADIVKKTFSKSDGIVKVFPNPAQHRLFVDWPNQTGKQAVIRIINQVGTTIEEVTIDELTAAPFEMDLSNSRFTNGLYFLQAQIGEEALITKKFMVSNR